MTLTELAASIRNGAVSAVDAVVAFARTHGLIALGQEGNLVRVATHRPLDVQPMDDLAAIMGTEVVGAERSGAGWVVRCRVGSEVREIEGRAVVNATGPWANRVLDYGPAEIGFVFMYSGLVGAVSQFTIIGPLAKRVGEMAGVAAVIVNRF